MTEKAKGIGINKVEWLLMVPGMRKHLKKALKGGMLDTDEALRAVAWFTNRLERAADKNYKPIFGSLTDTLESIAALTKEEEMVKFELGITVGEITAMLPAILAKVWENYSDDKNISVAEGLEIIEVILSEMEQAADGNEVKALLASIASVVVAVVPFVEEEEAPVE